MYISKIQIVYLVKFLPFSTMTITSGFLCFSILENLVVAVFLVGDFEDSALLRKILVVWISIIFAWTLQMMPSLEQSAGKVEKWIKFIGVVCYNVTYLWFRMYHVSVTDILWSGAAYKHLSEFFFVHFPLVFSNIVHLSVLKPDLVNKTGLVFRLSGILRRVSASWNRFL